MYGLSAVFTIVDQLPPITLVSNTGQTRSNESGAVQSQPFTTGSNLGGYTLTSVDVGFQGDNVRTRLFHIVPNQGNGEPDLSDPTKFITLTTPGTTTANKIHTFAAPADARLAANTTYHLYLANSDGGVPGKHPPRFFASRGRRRRARLEHRKQEVLEKRQYRPMDRRHNQHRQDADQRLERAPLHRREAERPRR